MDHVDKILESLRKFQKQVFPEHRERFRSLSSQQNPEVLLLTCSDSRIVPELLLQSRAGELFVCRNAGNIAPPHGESLGGVSATIEYAVEVLKVRQLVVCGHSDCGAMKGLMHPEMLEGLLAVPRWLAHSRRALAVVHRLHPDADDAERLTLLIRENVVAQMANLMTHPCVAAGMKAGSLTLHGWVFDIPTGEFDIYDERNGTFTPLSAERTAVEEVVHA